MRTDGILAEACHFEEELKDDVLGSPFLYSFQFTRVQKVDVYRKLAIGAIELVPVPWKQSYEELSAIFRASSTTVRMILFNSAFQPISRHFSHCPRSSFDSISSVS